MPGKDYQNRTHSGHKKQTPKSNLTNPNPKPAGPPAKGTPTGTIDLEKPTRQKSGGRKNSKQERSVSPQNRALNKGGQNSK